VDDEERVFGADRPHLWLRHPREPVRTRRGARRRRVDAVVLARERRHDDATILIDEAVAWVLRTDALIDIADVNLCEAEVHALAGRPDQGREGIARASEAFARKGATVGEHVVARRREELGL
jgi:hypothetical protein